jgi:hypothetical protein
MTLFQRYLKKVTDVIGVKVTFLIAIVLGSVFSAIIVGVLSKFLFGEGFMFSGAIIAVVVFSGVVVVKEGFFENSPKWFETAFIVGVLVVTGWYIRS